MGLAALLLLAACDGSTEPLIPASIQLVAGDTQTAAVGTAVGIVPSVRIRTADGHAVSGVTVNFAVTGGGGTLASAQSVTDRSGIAYAGRWVLGNVAGDNALTITSGQLPSLTVHARGRADEPAQLQVTRQPPSATASGAVLAAQPVVRLVDRFGNASPRAGILVTATVLESGATLTNATATTDSSGEAAFKQLSINAPAGSYTLEFRAAGLTSVRATLPVLVGSGMCGDAGSGAFRLDLPLGGFVRRPAAAGDAPTCLEFDMARATGQQYLVMFENVPLTGPSDQALFTGADSAPSFRYAVRGAPVTPSGDVALRMLRLRDEQAAAEAAAPHQWDFGDGPIYEGVVRPVDFPVAEPKVLHDGAQYSLSSLQLEPQVGDTIANLLLEGIPRLGIPTSGTNRAVIRYVSNELIIAEDVRLPTLLRDGSTASVPLVNTPLTDADMQAIASEYAAYSRVQGDLFFQGRYNATIEAGTPQRVVAVHTLMYDNNIWGYTYMAPNYFAFDYWVGTNGATKGMAQHPQRLADDLFMHEIAHMRHWGMLQRAGRTSFRGNTWLVEGFARFTERFPIANRLLGSVTPSRTANVVLPRNPAFNGAYYFDDVPTYLRAGLNMFGGYAASSYVFDYLADQVAVAGGDPLAALRDFLVNGGTQASADAAVSRWIPSVPTFAELFTRARVALYADDYGAGLPAWTQYHQYQLRASRPPGTQTANDPRNAWPKVRPGDVFTTDWTELTPGTASGVLIRGDSALASAKITIETSRAPGGVISITRIR